MATIQPEIIYETSMITVKVYPNFETNLNRVKTGTFNYRIELTSREGFNFFRPDELPDLMIEQDNAFNAIQNHKLKVQP